MALSLGRRLYNLTGRREAGVGTALPPRPPGLLVWLHAPTLDSAARLVALAGRLREEFGTTAVLSGAVVGATAHLHCPPPADVAGEVRPFLDHWAPDLMVFSEGEIRPSLLFEAESRGIPVIIVDGEAPYLTRGREGWFPGLLRGAVQTLRHVFALDEGAARAYRRAGAAQVEVTGRMESVSAALPCHEGERAALATVLASRPVWLAAAVPQAEEAAVIAAHRAALRMTHRLLLILVPENPERAEALARSLEADEGWMIARRALEEEPEAETAVYLPDGAAEYGLWYRLAPVTYLGGSLEGEGALRTPMEPAALGSAILHGPRPGDYGMAFGRLGAARGARAVGVAADLAEALAEVLAPDRAARLAQAAWTVATEGTEVTETVLARIGEILEARVS